MGEIVGFVPKAELERLRLIREARAIYESIFPPTDAGDEQPYDKPARLRSPAEQATPSTGNIRVTARS
jgi:hypothetical protein